MDRVHAADGSGRPVDIFTKLATWERRRSGATAPRAQLESHGSIWLLRPLNDATKLWLSDTAPEDAQFFGDALAIEPRHVEGVVEAFTNAGGEVS